MEYNQQEQHQLQLEAVYQSGAVEWYCKTCGRRLLFQGPPDHEMIVLEAGDPFAIHTGSAGGIEIGQALIDHNRHDDVIHADDIPELNGVRSAADDTGIADGEDAWKEDPSLDAWIEWMERVNFDRKWRRQGPPPG